MHGNGLRAWGSRLGLPAKNPGMLVNACEHEVPDISWTKLDLHHPNNMAQGDVQSDMGVPLDEGVSFELLSKLLVSPLITPKVVPYIILYITPYKEFRLWLIWDPGVSPRNAHVISCALQQAPASAPPEL